MKFDVLNWKRKYWASMKTKLTWYRQPTWSQRLLNEFSYGQLFLKSTNMAEIAMEELPPFFLLVEFADLESSIMQMP